MSLPAATSPPAPCQPIVVRSTGGDDTARVQAAFDRLSAISPLGYAWGGGRPELIIDGLCNVSSGIVYNGEPALIRGATPYSGLNAIAGAEAADVLTIRGTAAFYARSVHVRGLLITSGVAKTAGYGIKVDVSASWVRVMDCSVQNQWDGIGILRGSQECYVERNGITGMKRHGIHVNVYDATGASAGYGTEPYIIDNTIYGDGNFLNSGAGIRYEMGDSVHLRGNHCVLFKYGLHIAGTAARAPEHGISEIHGNVFSDNGGDAVFIDGTTYTVGKLMLSDNFYGYTSSGASGWGLRAIGSNLKALVARGGVVQGNPSGGIFLGAGPRDTLIEGVSIGKNGNAGIELEAAAQGFRLLNNRCVDSNFGVGVGVTQPYGIKYGGSHDNCIIMGNDLRGNATAPTTGTAPTPSSTVVLTGNI